MKQKILEMGLCEGLEVSILNEGPFGRDPIAVLVEGHIVAMRRAEAATITVEPIV
jgi:ferrous iron transport protein A